MIKEKIVELLNKNCNSKLDNTDFEITHPDLYQHGDFTSNIALKLKGGRAMAESIVNNIGSSDFISKVEVAGPGFINIWLNSKILFDELKNIISEKDSYGKSDWGKNKKWVIEHTSPNPNKAMHFGHLRNNIIGMAIANIWEFCGINVIRDEVDNNRGISIAKLMWGFLKFAHRQGNNSKTLDYWVKHQEEWLTPYDAKVKPDHFVDDLYVKASIEMESNPEVEKEIRQMVIDWESGDSATHMLWKVVLDYSYEGQKITLKRLGNKWDFVWHEHEHYKQGKDFVADGLSNHIFQKGEHGAVITDLKKYNLPDTVVLKSDGTALYITQDISLTYQKILKYQPDKIFWVIGPEQSLAMKQMFAVCEQLGIGKKENMIHLPYGYVSVKGSGKMSSRKGNAIFIDNLLDMAKDTAKGKITSLEVNEVEKEAIAEIVGVGSIKYNLLKVSRMQDVEVDIEEAVSFDGNSGAYIQYAYARTQSIIRKSNFKINVDNMNLEELLDVITDEEMSVLRWIYRFPEVVGDAARNFEPNILANFLYELVRKFNTFYNECPVLKTKDENQKEFRIALTTAVGYVLKNGLALLGIQTIDRM